MDSYPEYCGETELGRLMRGLFAFPPLEFAREYLGQWPVESIRETVKPTGGTMSLEVPKPIGLVFAFGFRAVRHEYDGPANALLAAELDNFAQAIARVRSMATTIVGVAYLSEQMGQLVCVARNQLGIPVDDPRLDQSEQMFAARMAAFDSWGVRHDGMNEEEVRASFSRGSQSAELIIQMAYAMRNAGIGDPAIANGIESVFASMVMAAYSAYEVLAGGVWTILVNSDDDLAMNWIEANQLKGMQLKDVFKYGFNNSGKMGTLLQEWKKQKFVSFGEIRDAYKDAFAGGAQQCFEPLDQLVGTEKLRHLLAHQGGKVDKKFLEEAGHIPEFAAYSVGQQIQLDGRRVQKHVQGCIDAGVKLMKFADDHLGRKATT